MNPRHADVAFVLEGVPGVLQVYALRRPADSAGDLEFAVKLTRAGQVAVAHYALLRVLSHDDCRGILFFEVDLPPALRERASRLTLSDAEREAARARVPPTSAALEQEAIAALGSQREPARVNLRALIVDRDVDVYRAVATSLGEGAALTVEPDPFAAFWKVRDGDFDLILCDARLAFGRNGLLPQLLVTDPVAARRVVLLAHEGERDLLASSLDELRCWVSFLCRPLDPDALREILRTGLVIQRWSIPILPPRKPKVVDDPLPDASRVRRVVVVDDDPATQLLLASMGDGPLQVAVTSDEWDAVDLVTAAGLALVVCSISMRTRGGTPFYRLLWNARPDIKWRFVFIARSDAIPSSAADGRGAPVVERPLSRDVIVELVERFAPS